VRLEAVVLQQIGHPAPAERSLERHRRPRRQITDQPQERLGAIHHVLAGLHRPVPGDYIAAVGVDRVRALARASAAAADWRDGADQRHELGDVVAVAAGQGDR
jgi:hypothetical protein